jgi:hypothetical protein
MHPGTIRHPALFRAHVEITLPVELRMTAPSYFTRRAAMDQYGSLGSLIIEVVVDVAGTVRSNIQPSCCFGTVPPTSVIQ